ncbi:doublecortin domain-containing protein 2-like isoform X2 [Anguilla anguilla]|uniref:doublecortin domain-containing protein 2-like isoform X2 n=1 Tax=Anguilla anguilla TaxID=7936 RepID=UPI0015AC9205|nr:doublecortin domain-containing protein 2-like isoform X2 [Anguilla anguilla]
MMNSDKPNFLSQPVVKNIFVYRNGDPYYEGRRLVINEKRVSNFETFLKEVTGGVQAPFGAVRTIYTPKAGHRVSSLEHLQSGEQYVAAGKEKFKKLDYLQIGTKKKKMLQSNGQVKPVPQSRIIVSARFLKPIREPCTILRAAQDHIETGNLTRQLHILANGDVLNPAIRLLIPQRILVQHARVLEMITEKMGLRVLGGVRSLYTLDGTIISEGKDLENGQFYVAVGREKFKKLPYSELIFNKPIGMRRFVGSKAASLPPIYRFRKQNGNVGRDQSKSIVSNGEAEETKTSPLTQQKEHLATIVSELSQARLLKLRQKKSGMTMSLGGQSNDDGEQGAAEGPGESSGNQEAQPPEGSKDDACAEEISEEAKGTSKDPDDCTEKDEGVEKPIEDGDGGGGKEEKSEEKSDSPSPSNEKNEEKSDNSASAPEEKETEGKLEEGKEEAKPEDREPDNTGQSGEGEVSGDGTEESPPAEAVSKDQGEEGQGSVVEDKPEQEKAGSSETKKENAEEEEEKPSDQIQEEPENKEEEESGGHKGSEKEDQGGEKE